MNTYLIDSGRAKFPIPDSFLEQAISRQPIGLPIRPLSELEARRFIKTGALPKQKEQVA